MHVLLLILIYLLVAFLFKIPFQSFLFDLFLASSTHLCVYEETFKFQHLRVHAFKCSNQYINTTSMVDSFLCSRIEYLQIDYQHAILHLELGSDSCFRP